MNMVVLANCRIGADATEVISIDKSVKVETKSDLDNLVIVFNSGEKSAQQDANVIYNVINKVAKRVSNIALVITDAYDASAKILSLLLVKHGIYNVFIVDDLLDVDDDYLESISEAKVDMEELGQFIGNDIAAYGKTREVIKSISSSANKSDGTIAELVRNNKSNIDSIIKIMELLQETVDSNCEQLANGGGIKSSVDSGLAARNLKEIQRLNSIIEDNDREVSRLKIRLEKADKEVSELREYKENVSNQMASNPLSDKYVTLNVDRFINMIAPGKKKPLIKDVIYIREISPCRYINSFIVKLNKYLVQQCGLRCKLIIYDKKAYSNFRYGSLKVVDGGEYERLKRSPEIGSAFVATEVARNIIEDLLSENEVLIIYDRFGGDNDIVNGRNVHNYYVLNGLKEFIELGKVKQVEKNFIITNFGVDKHMISIPDIYEYKMMSEGGKFSAYVNMPSTIDATKSNYEIIMNDSDINRWLRTRK